MTHRHGYLYIHAGRTETMNRSWALLQKRVGEKDKAVVQALTAMDLGKVIVQPSVENGLVELFRQFPVAALVWAPVSSFHLQKRHG